jgi:hypothetical protein
MSADFAQIQPDSTGKKIETVPVPIDGDNTSLLHRQTTSLGSERLEEKIVETLGLILAEITETRRILCEIGNLKFEELPN